MKDIRFFDSKGVSWFEDGHAPSAIRLWAPKRAAWPVCGEIGRCLPVSRLNLWPAAETQRLLDEASRNGLIENYRAFLTGSGRRFFDRGYHLVECDPTLTALCTGRRLLSGNGKGYNGAFQSCSANDLGLIGRIIADDRLPIA